MDNKEAIEVLNLVNKVAKNPPFEFYDALSLAIKAVKNEQNFEKKKNMKHYIQRRKDEEE